MTDHVVRKLRSCCAAAIITAAAAGCAQKVSQTTQMGDVVSSTPNRDRAAYIASDEALSQVQFGTIEKKAPKGVPQVFETKHKGTVTEPPDPDKRRYRPRVSATGTESDTATGAATAAEPAPAPTTQPVSPAAQAAAMPEFSEENLPVQVIYLPENKVRLIWELRNYGGSTVSSTRDPSTSRRTVALKDADLTPLTNMLTASAGAGATVLPLPRENTVVVTCDKAYKSLVLQTLASIDVPPRQVEISAKIFEVSSDFDFQMGAQVITNRVAADGTQSALSLFSTKKALDAAAGGAPFQGGVINLMKTFQEYGISIDAQFQFLADAGMIKVVSQPRMTVAAGQTGYMLAGQELPIQTANLVNNVVQTSTQYKPVGVQLYITPQAVGPNRVKLHTISIVSSVAGFSMTPSLSGKNQHQSLVNPIIESREAETAVTVQDGDTLVISGLRMIRTTVRENKIPGLGDVPVFGALFKSERSQQSLTDLYFFVTPTLQEVAAAE
jgi:type II secretory pathway component GspD/PulD (secretin)